ncbi:TonB-dependent receptor [Undibacterium squillarum]|uniref:TonB-dependent receptor n=1 Tax=Undibacterium squillarum TaxID=1131567 RepID=UPI0035AEE8D6
MSKNRLVLKKKLVAHALMLAFAASASSVVYAQSNTTGSIYGQVSAPAGASILIENNSVGFKRTLTPDANGRFQALSLPVGEYKVSLIRDGKVERSEDVSVSIGAGKEVPFNIAQVQVVGRAVSRIDVSDTNQGLTFTAKELAKIPVANNMGAVIQLAPSAVKGDPRYGGSGAPSIGGASASENAYYINGFPVTNPLTQVGFSQLPFNSIQTAQVLTGGYGAEFGRSTGGVVNVVTKSGTNDWVVGGAFSYSPDALRATSLDIVYPNSNNKVRQKLANEQIDSWMASAYVGGPLIKDKLFGFVNVEQNRYTRTGTRLVDSDPASGASGWEERTMKTPRMLAKFDWKITDDHSLEYTLVRDTPKDNRKYFGYDYKTNSVNRVKGGEVNYESYGPNPIAAPTGGNLDILKYTGHFGDDFTLTAMYGRTKIDRVQEQIGYNPAMPQINVVDAAPGINYVNNQPFTDDVFAPGSYNKSSGYRLDIEYRVNNSHTLRAGIDQVKLNSYGGTSTAGGILWNYESDTCGAQIAAPGAPLVPTNLQNGTTCYFAHSHQFKAINPAKVDQSAQYIEDKWQINKDMLLVLGLRNEQFTNFNDQGQAFIKQDRQIEPRIAGTWDFAGDGQSKASFNIGRYHLQMPANVAIRGAGASTFIDQYFSYTGIDPTTGAPTGLVALTPKFSPDGETGNPKDVGYVAAKNLGSHYQDEIALGIEKALSKSLNVGAKVTYRVLKNTLEDFCDPRPIQNWAKKNGVATDKFDGTGKFAVNGPAWSCAIINPGKTNVFELDVDGDGKNERVVLTPQDLAGGQSTRDGAAMPEASRKYLALDFFAEHPYDGKWYGRVNYTWSRSEGNTEGQLNSDLGQSDPAATVSYDFKELMEYANGRLPNDRTHVIKAFGFYSLTSEVTVGANLLLASGRPRNCLGKYPDPANLASQNYGSSLFHYCGTGADPSQGTPAPSPRGSVGNLPWTKTLDLNVSYRPNWMKELMFKVDVFNVFNNQSAEQIRERALPANRYGMVESYAAPRSAKLTVQYDKKF